MQWLWYREWCRFPSAACGARPRARPGNRPALLPPHGLGKKRVDDRRVVNGIFYVLRTGSPWRDLPERYGPYTTVYNRFNRWAKRGVWLAMFEALAAKSPQSLHLIDSSIIRAHQHAAGGKKGVRITPLAVLMAD